MADTERPEGQHAGPYRKTLRLTFRVANGTVQLVDLERLDMICPPSVGEHPEAGIHGGFWMELRDANNRVLFHRVVEDPLGDSVTVHSPDGKLQRVYGPAEDHDFEILLPDDSKGEVITFVGEPLQPATARRSLARAVDAGQGAATRELARFSVPKG